MTEQMVHVSCQWNYGVALRWARRKCVGSWETLQHSTASSSLAGARWFLLNKRKEKERRRRLRMQGSLPVRVKGYPRIIFTSTE